MSYSALAACLLAFTLFPAHADSEFQITCPGRATMTISRAQYGLTTAMWPGHHFQIASGRQRSQINGGDRVTITRFRNGDQLIVDKSSDETFFAFNNSNELVPCARSSDRESDAISLERYADSATDHS
ncbi:hypothetical protein J2125_004236 [Erwinia toletana]|uniref:C-type lysozyme inhibitor domain-containing protein n=1 Tax=Winslowiella toletana TaxID=92490 RepID=A0ABS4PEI0_9GAMM|nr:hypothetical protein [Winslowiella toletana]MBP2171044.1 hypothetical protein [Winslowiella toletana]